MMPLRCPTEDKGAGHAAAEGKIPRGFRAHASIWTHLLSPVFFLRPPARSTHPLWLYVLFGHLPSSKREAHSQLKKFTWKLAATPKEELNHFFHLPWMV